MPSEASAKDGRAYFTNHEATNDVSFDAIANGVEYPSFYVKDYEGRVVALCEAWAHHPHTLAHGVVFHVVKNLLYYRVYMPLILRELGIDMGSTSTRIFIPETGIVYDEPTVLAFDTANPDDILAIGARAYEMLGRVPSGINIVCPIQRGLVVDQKNALRYLRYAIRQVRGLVSLTQPDVVLASPTDITDVEERVMYELGKNITNKGVYPVPSSILAAVGSDVEIDELQGRMIVTIGGGVTSVAIMSLGGMLSQKTIQVGGSDMDIALVRYIHRKHNLDIGLHTAEKIKNGFGTVLDTNRSDIVINVKGRDTITNLPKVIKIHERDIAEAIQEPVEKIIQAINFVFRNTPPELISDIIDYGVIVSGAVAHLNGLAQLIGERIGTPSHIADVPEHAVIRGIGKIIAGGYVKAHKMALLSK